ncbi:MAG TPA: calcium-translocating P-type ATPase, PMCA-type [Candidatus Scybalousia intestinigallinarum]|nr:calcium-translocating P-type ATPase, PMCA-type [Candidatus Scybalousia intestinigallinarum]
MIKINSNHVVLDGLTKKEVEEARKKYGTNELSHKKQKSFFGQLIETLGDPIIKILLIALAIKTVFLFQDFDWFETLGIVIAIFLASFISTISEYGSEKAFARLQEEASKLKCKVKREKTIQEIPIDDIVVGDIIKLETGDKIPADGYLVDGELSVDESSLNGETKEAYKEKVIGEITEKNRIYRGTVVYAKSGYMKVEKVGNDTYYGKLALELQEKNPDSPLKIKLAKLAKTISRIGYIGAILVSLSYLFSEIVLQNGFNLDKIIKTVTNFRLMSSYLLYALTLSVTIIVVAVPEGLPMMITLVLSSNMKRMLKNNVLVRKLVGIETAGSINILFTDKTGTLTKGKLEVIGLISGSLKKYTSEVELSPYPKFHELLKVSLVYNNESNYTEDGKVVGGNITDRAILNFIKTPVSKQTVLKTMPFDSKNKYSSTVIDGPKKLNLIKGAPEIILNACNKYYHETGKKLPLEKEKIEEKIKEMTGRGIRVLCVAINDNYDYQSLKNLTLIGLILIKDEIRPDAKEGIKLVNDANIQTVMITGDNKDTALAIGKEVGLITSHNDIVMTSQELQNYSDQELKKLLPHLRIIARSLPQDKSRLVRIAEEMNLVVGMTGDGVNDAPALKKADVGFAMGSGTEVAKEASEIVILDDNFLSISKAILYGRTIFKSIRKFIIFQLTVNMCAISLSIVGPFIGVETPVTVIQMLWINMIMDTLAGIAFAYEPPLKEYMKEKPKKKDENIINRYMLDEIIFTGLYSSLLCIFFLRSPLIHGLYRIDITNKYLMTAFFGLFIFIGIFNCFNARTERLNLIANLHKNQAFVFIIGFIVIVQLLLIYFGGDLFRTFGLTFKELIIMIVLASTVIPVDWLRKIYLKKKDHAIGV